jgi:hypothetical protein
MAEARFPVYDVAYGTIYNANLRATVAAESEGDIESMLEQQVKAFFPDLNPEIYTIRNTKYLSDRMGVISNTLLEISRSPVLV